MNIPLYLARAIVTTMANATRAQTLARWGLILRLSKENYFFVVCKPAWDDNNDFGFVFFQCPVGYTGRLCESCEMLRCENNGVCKLDIKGKPSCSCNKGFSGYRCDKSICDGYCLNKVHK